MVFNKPPHSINSLELKQSQSGSDSDSNFMEAVMTDFRSRRSQSIWWFIVSPPYPIRVAVQFILLAWVFFGLKYLPIPFFSSSRFEEILNLGIIPGRVESWSGIILAPLIHADINHLLVNHTIFFQLVFLSILLPFKEWRIIFLLTLSTGVAVWSFAMQGNHVGASGLIYALQGFNLVLAFYKHYWLLGGILLLWSFLNSSFVEGIFGWFSFSHSNISYSSHVWGLISGLIWGLVIGRYVISRPAKLKP